MNFCMDEGQSLSVDVAIFGGGVAGLWVLDGLRRAGYRAVLLETGELGSGQTVNAQGILHGGLKYSLGGMVTRSARAIRDMPGQWRDCLKGLGEPSLTKTRVRAEFCYLWQSVGISGKMAMMGARAGLRIKPSILQAEERPEVLRQVKGPVARLDEQVIDPVSMVWELSNRHRSFILKVDWANGVEFATNSPGDVEVIRLIDPESGTPLDLYPRCLVLTAGAGNSDIHDRLKLKPERDLRMQLRPLHMVMVKGKDLPILNGHCVDGMATRATITADQAYDERTVWQIGGQIAEEGVKLDEETLIGRTREVMDSIVPGINWKGLEWASYRVNRAEGLTRNGRRPEHAVVVERGRTISVWPTKLVLAPTMVDEVLQKIRAYDLAGDSNQKAVEDLAGQLKEWSRPTVAVPPWEEDGCRWNVVD